MRFILTFTIAFISAAFIGEAYLNAMEKTDKMQQIARVETIAPNITSKKTAQNHDPFQGRNLSGRYLSSQFAQRHHDWAKAEQYLGEVLTQIPDDIKLTKRAMYLAMGSGEVDDALKYARNLDKLEKNNSLSMLFLAVGHFKKQEYKSANILIQKISEDTLSKFVIQLLRSWSLAAINENSTKELNSNTIHVHHAILIADYLKDYGQIESLLQKALDSTNPNPRDLERIGDIYAHIGRTNEAINIYEKLAAQQDEDSTAKKKITELKSGKKPSYFEPITQPEHGVALTLYDMAHLLYQERSDENARVFAHMATYLNPDLTDAKLLLAEINARHNRYDEAIRFYTNISPDSERFMDAQRRAADLLEDNNRKEEALALLENLSATYGDIKSIIRIGDIHRRSDDYKSALIYYNKAAKALGPKIPDEYWRLLYVRGMSNERAGNWHQAENDLKAALKIKPDNPFIMNYLGYSWADRGINLDESLKLIKSAVLQKPSDGYITDSLGWVFVRMKRYEEAAPYLEKAVELLPYDPVINDHLGDAYWLVGRKLEAKFQWERAKNHSDDEALIEELRIKISQGITEKQILKASSENDGNISDNLNP